MRCLIPGPITSLQRSFCQILNILSSKFCCCLYGSHASLLSTLNELAFYKAEHSTQRTVVGLDLLIYLHIMLTYTWNCSPFARNLRRVRRRTIPGVLAQPKHTTIVFAESMKGKQDSCKQLSYWLPEQYVCGTGHLPVTSSLYIKSLPARRDPDAATSADPGAAHWPAVTPPWPAAPHWTSDLRVGASFHSVSENRQ